VRLFFTGRRYVEGFVLGEYRLVGLFSTFEIDPFSLFRCSLAIDDSIEHERAVHCAASKRILAGGT
jgi:hypothetical protein